MNGLRITNPILIGFAVFASFHWVCASRLRSQDVALKTNSKLQCTLSDERIKESSGLARSSYYPNCFWTHNDSGDTSRIFLFDESGKTRADVEIVGAKAVDWEDMAIFESEAGSMVVVADIGDNGLTRRSVQLYFFVEPKFDFETTKTTPIRQEVWATLEITIPEGPMNCESICVDRSSKTVYMIEKKIPNARVFSVPIPDQAGRHSVRAKVIGNVMIPTATSADISKDGKSLIVLNYVAAFLYSRTAKPDGSLETWNEALTRPGKIIEMPVLRQAEAICFGGDERTFYLTSEQLPTPLYQVQLTDVPNGN